MTGKSRRGLTSLTIKDISQAADVSTATVSRMLNAPHLVSDRTRERIEAAIARTGYTPNAAARALRSRRSMTIGAIVPSIGNSLYAVMLEGFKRSIERENYDLLLSSFDYDGTRVFAQVEKFVQRGVDGVFIASVEPDPRVVKLLTARRIPFATTWLPDAGDAGDAARIVYDHNAAAAKPATYLAELGHQKFGIITGPRQRNRRLAERHAAIIAALAAEGVPGDRIATVEIQTYDLKTAREGFRRLLAGGTAPTAIIASNDIAAAGVVLECRAQGLRVPGDISVTGFGNMDIARHFHPAISSVQTPRESVGKLAGDYLLALIAGTGTAGSVCLDFEFVVRDSTGRAP